MSNSDRSSYTTTDYYTISKGAYTSLVNALGVRALFTSTPDNQEGVILADPLNEDVLIVFVSGAE